MAYDEHLVGVAMLTDHLVEVCPMVRFVVMGGQKGEILSETMGTSLEAMD